MYPRLLLNLCKQSLCRVSSNYRFRIGRLSHIANRNKETQVETVSTRFPGYKIIYTFPYIKHACAVNVAKRRFTAFIGAAAPVIVGFHLANIASSDIVIASIISGFVVTIWLHTLGILCNNLVGYIYLKLDEEKVILSYINYWGKRMDLETTVSEIIPMSDNPMKITDSLYNRIMFASQEQKLKINIKYGRITDVENFRYALGAI